MGSERIFDFLFLIVAGAAQLAGMLPRMARPAVMVPMPTLAVMLPVMSRPALTSSITSPVMFPVMSRPAMGSTGSPGPPPMLPVISRPATTTVSPVSEETLPVTSTPPRTPPRGTSGDSNYGAQSGLMAKDYSLVTEREAMKLRAMRAKSRPKHRISKISICKHHKIAHQKTVHMPNKSACQAPGPLQRDESRGI